LLIMTIAWSTSNTLLLYPGKVLFCVCPKALTTPVTYTLSTGPKLKLAGFGLADRGPAMPGSIAGGEDGAAAASAGLASAGGVAGAGVV
jgi:hypothetical protein